MIRPRILSTKLGKEGDVHKRTEMLRYRGQEFYAVVDADSNYELYYAPKGKIDGRMSLLPWGGLKWDELVVWLNNNIE